MGFNIGEKVVFVDKRFLKLSAELIIDKIYTVTRNQTCGCGVEMIGVAEAVQPLKRCYCSVCRATFFKRWFDAKMFRRLSTGYILDELLDKNPLTEEVPDITPKKEEKERTKEKKKEKV